MKIARFCLIGIPILLSVPQPTLAQYTDMLGTSWSHPLSATMSTMIWNKINEHSITGSYGKPSRKTPVSSTSTSTSNDYPSTPIIDNVQPLDNGTNRAVQFKSTGTRLMLQTLVDAMEGTPQEKAEAKTLLTGFLDNHDATARSLGYPNDLAFALVSYISINNAVLNDKPRLSSEKTIEMRNLLAADVAQRGAFSQMSDRQKQQTYEVLVMTGGIADHAYDEAKSTKNSEDLKNAKMVAAQNLRNIGIQP